MASSRMARDDIHIGSESSEGDSEDDHSTTGVAPVSASHVFSIADAVRAFGDMVSQANAERTDVTRENLAEGENDKMSGREDESFLMSSQSRSPPSSPSDLGPPEQLEVSRTEINTGGGLSLKRKWGAADTEGVSEEPDVEATKAIASSRADEVWTALDQRSSRAEGMLRKAGVILENMAESPLPEGRTAPAEKIGNADGLPIPGATDDGGDPRPWIRDLVRECRLLREEINGARQGRIAQAGDLEDERLFFEARCGYLERTALSMRRYNGEWNYSAPRVRESQWLEVAEDEGYESAYADSVSEFLTRLRILTHWLRGGRFKQSDFRLDGADFFDAGETTHHALMMPCWLELTDALQFHGGRGEGFDKIQICNLNLPQEVLDALNPALRMIKTRKLLLQNIYFCRGCNGINFAVSFIRRHPDLEDFSYLENTKIDSVDDADRLVEAIGSMPALQRINLHGMGGNHINCHGLLSSLLSGKGNCNNISLRYNNIPMTEITILSDYIATNPPLEYLLLEENRLNDHAVTSIAGALAQNQRLRFLFLEGNDVTEAGVEALEKAINCDTSLNSVATSNHTCKASITCKASNGSTFLSNPNESKWSREWKILSLLSSRNKELSNAHYLESEFGEDSLKLFPNVLGCIGTHGKNINITDALSIFYELVQYWNIPSLWEIDSRKHGQG